MKVIKIYAFKKPEKRKLTINPNKYMKKIKSRILNEIEDLQIIVKINKSWLSKDQNRKREKHERGNIVTTPVNLSRKSIKYYSNLMPMNLII